MHKNEIPDNNTSVSGFNLIPTDLKTINGIQNSVPLTSIHSFKL